MDHLLSLVATGIKDVINHGGYAGVVILMAVESACIPLPSEVTMPFAGALTVAAIAEPRAPMNFHLVALAGVAGESVGSTFAYCVGASGGRGFIARYGRYVLLNMRDVARAEVWFARFGRAAVFTGRLVPIVRTFISLPAGIARMEFRRFLALSVLGSVIWCYGLTFLGLEFGRNLDEIKHYFHGADTAIGAVLLTLLLAWIYRHVRHARGRQAEPTDGAVYEE